MKVRFVELIVQCKSSMERVRFSSQVNFFHGKTGSGKSSIARMIDFCLGGELEQTPAVRKEVIQITLVAEMAESSCIFERTATGSSQVHVTWKDKMGFEHHVLAPKKASTTPIFGDSIYNLSDLIFHLCGVTPIRVRRNKSDEDAPLVRLSFRNLMWYCYLEQDQLDSSFYHLREPIMEAKSRDVMRFVSGYYTEKLQELETLLDKTVAGRVAKIEACDQMRAFLLRLGYSSEEQIGDEITEISAQLETERARQSSIRSGFTDKTHFADELREKLRKLSGHLSRERDTLAELSGKLEEEEALRAELTTARFKLARQDSASVLKGVFFEACPLCGTKIDRKEEIATNQCTLCLSFPKMNIELNTLSNTEIAKRDLEARIEELSDSITRVRKAWRRQEERVQRLEEQKHSLDMQLIQELRDYDSAFVAAIREVDRVVATYEERLNSLSRLKELPDTIAKLLTDADQSLGDAERIRREINTEKASLTSADSVVLELEDAFLEVLKEVRFPGVRRNDKVRISRQNWIPMILEGGDEDAAWSFFDTGSGGKKTLLNVCYALAVHRVAAKNGLPLPSFLIIDTPMKNISEDVNKELFEAFYRYLYRLVKTDLSTVQLIIIDNDYVPPPVEIEIIERFMTPDKKEFPPLISYYRGP